MFCIFYCAFRIVKAFIRIFVLQRDIFKIKSNSLPQILHLYFSLQYDVILMTLFHKNLNKSACVGHKGSIEGIVSRGWGVCLMVLLYTYIMNMIYYDVVSITQIFLNIVHR
jgi:hypothetical protein